MQTTAINAHSYQCAGIILKSQLLILLLPFLIIVNMLSTSTSAEDVTSATFPKGLNEFVYPVAFGDYNSDKLTDMVVLRNDSSTFDVYFGSNFAPYLSSKSNFHQCHMQFVEKGTNLGVTITGIVLADFTGDSVSDICVSFTVYSTEAPTKYKNITFVQVFKGSLGGTFDCQTAALHLNGSTSYLQLKAEPLVVDANGDTIADLFGETLDGKRVFWIFGAGQGPQPYVFQCSECDPTILALEFTEPGSNGFADMNGDFSPELLLILAGKPIHDPEPDHYLLILSITQVDSYNHVVYLHPLEPAITLPKPLRRIGNPIALDVGLSGQLSLLIPFCHDGKCKRSNFLLYDLHEGLRTANTQLSDAAGRTYGFLTKEADPVYGRSINFYVGDYNLDGYPDLMGVLLQTQVSATQAMKRAVLFKNTPCTEQTATGECDFGHKRQFVPDFSFLQEYSDTRCAFFFDLQEDGLLDVMMVGGGRNPQPLPQAGSGKSKKGKGTPSTELVSAFQNIPEYDAYFVKWIITTAVCDGRSTGSGGSSDCPTFNGVRAPGASMMYSTTDLSIRLQTSRATQSIRSHFALDFPYTVMGTGISSNFIETVSFGVTRSATFTKTQIIPNSILIATPPSPGTGSRWQVKQLLVPSVDGAIKTFRALTGICSLIGTVIFYLWLKERRQDKLFDEEQRNKPMGLAVRLA